MSDKVYIGSAKTRTTNFGEVLALSFSAKDIETMKSNLNEKWWVNIDLLKRKELGKYNETHYGVLNDWKPTPQPTTNGYESNTNISDVPF